MLLFIAGRVGAAPNNPPRAAGVSPGLVVGQAPPPLALDRIAGSDAVTLEGLAGRVVILDFWATWCRPCQALMPVLDGMHRRHQAGGLSIVGLSAEPDRSIRAHLVSSPVGYTIARDVGGTSRAYGVRAIPTLVVLDRAGDVREVMRGVDGHGLRRLSTLVDQLLREPAP